MDKRSFITLADMASAPCTHTSSLSASFSSSQALRSITPPAALHVKRYSFDGEGELGSRRGASARNHGVRATIGEFGVAMRDCDGDGGWWSARGAAGGTDGASVAGAVDSEDGSGEGWSWSRRGVVGASALALLATSLSLGSEPANAFSLGISGPKDWLKAQKRKTVQFLLNPIEASRDRLNSAVLLLSSDDGSSFANYEEAGRLVKVAARDCMPAELGSIIEFQSRTGVEVCTFRLVLKNAASLLDKNDPVKLKATAALDELIRSLVVASGLLEECAIGAATKKENVMGALRETMVALDVFQQGVQNCLDVA